MQFKHFHTLPRLYAIRVYHKLYNAMHRIVYIQAPGHEYKQVQYITHKSVRHIFVALGTSPWQPKLGPPCVV